MKTADPFSGFRHSPVAVSDRLGRDSTSLSHQQSPPFFHGYSFVILFFNFFFVLIVVLPASAPIRQFFSLCNRLPSSFRSLYANNPSDSASYFFAFFFKINYFCSRGLLILTVSSFSFLLSVVAFVFVFTLFEFGKHWEKFGVNGK